MKDVDADGPGKDALLSHLRIERDAARAPGSAAPRFIIPIIVGIAFAAGAAQFWTSSSTVPVVEVATAQAAADGVSASALLEASGYVVARREATVSSKVTGRVTELLIEEGQKVTAGQVIARLDASNVLAALDQATAQIGVAEASTEFARVTEANTRSKLTRVEELYRSGWVSNQALDDARAAYAGAQRNREVTQRQIIAARASKDVTGRSLDDTIVRAPFSGVVTVKAAQVGEIVSPSSAGGGFTRTGIGTIVDMNSLEVEVDVAESYINRVSTGMPAVVHLNAYPDWAIPAEVAAVIPTGDRTKATVKVRIRFQVEDARIIPEMGAKVSFLSAPGAQTSGQAGVVEIPAEAIVSLPNGRFAAFVIGDDLKVSRRPIRLGRRRGDLQAVSSSLAAGERVAVGRLAELRDGMRVELNGKD